MVLVLSTAALCACVTRGKQQNLAKPFSCAQPWYATACKDWTDQISFCLRRFHKNRSLVQVIAYMTYGRFPNNRSLVQVIAYMTYWRFPNKRSLVQDIAYMTYWGFPRNRSLVQVTAYVTGHLFKLLHRWHIYVPSQRSLVQVIAYDTMYQYCKTQCPQSGVHAMQTIGVCLSGVQVLGSKHRVHRKVLSNLWQQLAWCLAPFLDMLHRQKVTCIVCWYMLFRHGFVSDPCQAKIKARL